MKGVFELWREGTCYGRFLNERWAKTAAALFCQAGMDMEIECHPFVVSTQKEADEAFKRIKDNWLNKNKTDRTYGNDEH